MNSNFNRFLFIYFKLMFQNYSELIRNKCISNKIQWKDELLNSLSLLNEKYTPKEIENHLKNNFMKGKFLNFDNNQWDSLKIPGWKKKIRLSYFMNHIIHKFVINNDKPTTKYYSNDFNFYKLDNKEINDIICCL